LFDIGDFVAIRDHYDFYGRGRYEGAVTIGVCIHGFSKSAGHGPGLNPVLSALPGTIKTVIDIQTIQFDGVIRSVQDNNHSGDRSSAKIKKSSLACAHPEKRWRL